MTDPEDAGVLYNLACTYALAGSNDEAIEHLNKAIQNGFGQREWVENDPALDPIRGDPRYHTILRKL